MKKRQYTENRQAVAVDKPQDVMVGHMPHAISSFIRLGGVIDYIV